MDALLKQLSTHKKKIFLTLGILLVVGLGFLFYNALFQPNKVMVYTLQKEDVTAVLTVTGEVRADVSVSISARTNAHITSLPFDDGDHFNKGDFLVALDADDVSASLQEARFRATQSQASYQDVLNGPRPEQRQLLQAQLNDAEAILEQKKSAYESLKADSERIAKDAQRFETLYHDQIISTQEFDQSQTRLRQSENDLRRLKADIDSGEFRVNQAQEQYQQALNGATREERIQARAASQAAQSLVNQATARLNDYHITANFSGIVLKRLMEEGALATPAQPILRVADRNTLMVVAFVEEVDLPRLSVDDTAMVILDALPDTPLTGYISRIGNEVNAENGTVDVEILLNEEALKQVHEATESKNSLLLPGMTADINVVTDTLKNATVLPASSIRQVGAEKVVYVLKGNRFKAVSVKGSRISLEYFRVDSGLSDGDQVARFADTSLLEKNHIQAINTTLENVASKPTVPKSLK